MSSGHPVKNPVIDPAIKAALGWGAALLSAVVAYWDLLSFDPQAGIFRPTEGLERLFFEPTGNFPLPICLLVGWMVWRRRSLLRGRSDLARRSNHVLDLGCCFLALLIASWATHVGAPDLLVFSLQALLLAVGGWLGGSPGRRAMVFPAFALLLAVPIPPVLLNRLVFDLQIWTANACAALSNQFGLLAETAGVDIVTPRGVFRVIETCTGIGTIASLSMATIALSELLNRTARRALVLLLCVIPLAIFLNVSRILTIIANPYSELVAVHTTQGLVVVVIGVLLIAGIDYLLERGVPAARAIPDTAASGRAPRDGRFGVVLGGCIAVAVVVLATPRFHRVESPDSTPLSALPQILFGDRSEGLATDVAFLGSVAFTDRIDRGYGSGADQVRIFVGENSRKNRRGSILSEKTGYPGSGWRQLRREDLEIEAGIEADLSTYVSPEGLRQELHWHEGVESFGRELFYNFVGLDQSAVGARPGRARVFRVGIDLPGGKFDRRERLLRYADALRAPLKSASAADPRPTDTGVRTGKRLGN